MNFAKLAPKPACNNNLLVFVDAGRPCMKRLQTWEDAAAAVSSACAASCELALPAAGRPSFAAKLTMFLSIFATSNLVCHATATD